MNDVLLHVEGVSKEFVSPQFTTRAIERLDFRVRFREFVSIVGPSGCGKTTLLNILSGLMRPTGGTVGLRGEPIAGPPEGVILVFQDYSRSLLPWRTVRDNIAYGLELRRQKVPRDEVAPRTEKYLKAVGLEHFTQHYPWQLSGGMQQRIAIARALACEPAILLMDEPFGSLDAQTRAELEDSLLRIWAEFQQTILFVTHDIDEGIYLSDRVLVLRARPSVILEEITITLPRPRHQLATRSDAQFLQYRARIHGLIMTDSERSTNHA